MDSIELWSKNMGVERVERSREVGGEISEMGTESGSENIGI